MATDQSIRCFPRDIAINICRHDLVEDPLGNMEEITVSNTILQTIAERTCRCIVMLILATQY